MEMDSLLGYKRCPKYDIELENYLNSPNMKQIHDKYDNLLQYWSKMSGTNITTIKDVFSLYNTLVVEKETNKK